MSLKVSQLSEVTGLKASAVGNIMVQTAAGSQRISFANLRKSLLSEYPFRDAKELSYSWNDLKSMAQSGNFESDVRTGDFKTITLTNGETAIMEVAGINTNRKCGDSEMGNHIDFISRDCLRDTVQWNTAGDNNGTASENNPYLASSLYTYLTTTVYGWLPADVKGVISNRRALMETRYDAGSKINDSTNWAWKDLGKVWIPSEVEVYGQTVWGTVRWSAGDSAQYPIFRDGWAKRVKGAGNGGSRSPWWLRCARSGSSTHACRVDTVGFPNYISVTYTNIRVPLCFRIAA